VVRRGRKWRRRKRTRREMRRRAPRANMSDPIEDEAMVVVLLLMGIGIEEALGVDAWLG